jgi:hypothetical protein
VVEHLLCKLEALISNLNPNPPSPRKSENWPGKENRQGIPGVEEDEGRDKSYRPVHVAGQMEV